MRVRKILKQSDALVACVRRVRKLSRAVKPPDPRYTIIERYLESHECRKLQLGAGSNELDGWLNTDMCPKTDSIACLDVRQHLPFDDDEFDYVFSEHMLYQFDWQEGLSILSEYRRVLKPGGTVRVAEADLEVMIGLYTHRHDAQNQRFVEWACDRFPGVCKPMPSFVINNQFRAWCTQFLYDGELMALALQEAGFSNIKRCSIGESEDENLRGIESHGKAMSAEDMASFETMVFEGTCPL